MKQKVSDYIAEYIAQWGIQDVFTVTGGGAMHMNDAFGHHPKLHCTYQHHEQACAMAAEAYARYSGKNGCRMCDERPWLYQYINRCNGSMGR